MADTPQYNTTSHEPQAEQTASIFTRHKFEIRRRELTVTAKEFLTPKMIRITASGDDLVDFNSMAPDDHLKLLIDTGADKPEMRDYTPRFFDADNRVLVIDFAIHEAGPATKWAIDVKVGDRLRIGGPRGSSQLTEEFDWHLLIGDETALPAMGRWLEEAQEESTFLTLGIITEESAEQNWATKAKHNAQWAYRPVTEDTSGKAAIDALTLMTPPEGRGFIWIAAEATAAREIKAFLLDTWKHPSHHLKSSGYWVKGMADTTEK